MILPDDHASGPDDNETQPKQLLFALLPAHMHKLVHSLAGLNAIVEAVKDALPSTHELVEIIDICQQNMRHLGNNTFGQQYIDELFDGVSNTFPYIIKSIQFYD